MSCNAPICALCKVKSYSTSLENREAWFCTLCVKHIFPFNHIDNHDQYIQSIRGLSNEEYQLFILNSAPRVEFNLDSCDRIKLINSEEIDPDVNLFGEGLIDAHYNPPALLKKKLSININLSSIMHINCRSIRSKINDLHLLLHQTPVKYLALTETWLCEDTAYLLNIPGYKMVFKPRTVGIGGRVALLVREDIVFNILDSELVPKHSSYEGIFISVHQQKGPDLVIGAMYRPPGQPVSQFNEELNSLLHILVKNNRRIILSGDFNIDLIKVNNHEPILEFLNIFNSYAIIPMINYPTRITDHSATLIDNIFTNFSHEVVDPTIITSDFSDHFPIILWFGNDSPKLTKNNPTLTRVINDNSIKQFAEL